jgi:putative addiction module component (TIGR02574 family)
LASTVLSRSIEIAAGDLKEAAAAAPNESPGNFWTAIVTGICCIHRVTVPKEGSMAATMKELGIDQLSPAERVALALAIWESLGEARPQSPLTPEQQTMLARRDKELDANVGLGQSWEQLRARVEHSS